jgi:hypothetical protein
LELNQFKCKFELELHKLHFKKLRENTWRCPEGVEPQNPSQTWGGHKPSTHGGHHDFDLNSKWGQRKFKKKAKKGKPVHGVMICDVVPRKKIPNMEYRGFIEKLFTKNATRQEFIRHSTQLSLVCASSIANF